MSVGIIVRIVIILFMCVALTNSVGDNRDDSEYSVCGSTFPGRDILLCHCDAHCRHYKDCCHGFVYNKSQMNETTDLEHASTETRCVSLPGDQTLYVMEALSYTALPASVRRFIIPCQTPNHTQPVQALPIYNTHYRLSLRNYLCYQMFAKVKNIPIEHDSISMWGVTLSLQCFQRYVDGIYNDDRQFLDILVSVLSLRHCNITFVPPDNSTTRTCFQHKTEKCKNDAACQSYQSPVVGDTGTIYKNAHCAACSGSHVTSRLGDGEPLDDRKTLLTLYRPSVEEVIDGALRKKIVYNMTCPTDQIQHQGRCIQPVDKVRGLLHQVHIKTNSTYFLHIDNEQMARVVSEFIGQMSNIYVTSRMNTTKMAARTSGCQHVIQVLLYLRNDVAYKQYLNISNHIREVFENRKENLRSEVLNTTANVNKPCVAFKTIHDENYAVRRIVARNDQVMVIIFASVFGAFTLAVASITTLRVISSRITRTRRSNSEDDE